MFSLFRLVLLISVSCNLIYGAPSGLSDTIPDLSEVQSARVEKPAITTRTDHVEVPQYASVNPRKPVKSLLSISLNKGETVESPFSEHATPGIDNSINTSDGQLERCNAVKRTFSGHFGAEKELKKQKYSSSAPNNRISYFDDEVEESDESNSVMGTSFESADIQDLLKMCEGWQLTDSDGESDDESDDEAIKALDVIGKQFDELEDNMSIDSDTDSSAMDMSRRKKKVTKQKKTLKKEERKAAVKQRKEDEKKFRSSPEPEAAKDFRASLFSEFKLFNKKVVNFIQSKDEEYHMQFIHKSLRQSFKRLLQEYRLAFKEADHGKHKYLKIFKTKETRIPDNWFDLPAEHFKPRGIGRPKSHQTKSRAIEIPRQRKKDTPAQPVVQSAPAPELDKSNVGYQLLMKNGWTPGESIGAKERNGITEPIEVKMRPKLAGLGYA